MSQCFPLGACRLASSGHRSGSPFPQLAGPRASRAGKANEGRKTKGETGHAGHTPHPHCEVLLAPITVIRCFFSPFFKVAGACLVQYYCYSTVAAYGGARCVGATLGLSRNGSARPWGVPGLVMYGRWARGVLAALPFRPQQRRQGRGTCVRRKLIGSHY